jgi:hypothetical protein
MNTASVSALLSAARRTGWVREDRGAGGHVAAGTPVLLRVSRAAWRLDQAGRERSRAIAGELLRKNEDR